MLRAAAAAAAAVAKVSSTKIQHGSRSYNNITLVVKFSIVSSPPPQRLIFNRSIVVMSHTSRWKIYILLQKFLRLRSSMAAEAIISLWL